MSRFEGTSFMLGSPVPGSTLQTATSWSPSAGIQREAGVRSGKPYFSCRIITATPVTALLIE